MKNGIEDNLQDVCNSEAGPSREAGLARDVYLSSRYLDLKQLCAFAHQIEQLSKIGAQRILEVGKGNGFTAMFLKSSGKHVVTVDINESLEPDIVSDLRQLPEKLSESFDVVCCCEVLEHMPWSDLERSIGVLRRYAPTLFLTLPSARRFLGFGGFSRLPKSRVRSLWIPVPFIRKQLPPEHFWEVDRSVSTSAKAVRKVLLKHFKEVSMGRFDLYPIHQYFLCKA